MKREAPLLFCVSLT